jgi:hypothetical protein
METIMAANILTPGAAPANPAAHQPSRRALLGALAVAPIVAMPATAHAMATSALAGLSPLMHKAVMRWAASARAFGTFVGEVKRCNELCSSSHADACAVAALPAETWEDLAVKTYMLALVECGQIGPGPLVHDVDQVEAGHEETHLWRGIIRDLPLTSPAVRALIAWGEA